MTSAERRRTRREREALLEALCCWVEETAAKGEWTHSWGSTWDHFPPGIPTPRLSMYSDFEICDGSWPLGGCRWQFYKPRIFSGAHRDKFKYAHRKRIAKALQALTPPSSDTLASLAKKVAVAPEPEIDLTKIIKQTRKIENELKSNGP